LKSTRLLMFVNGRDAPPTGLFLIDANYEAMYENRCHLHT